jgi:hypothetical protein
MVEPAGFEPATSSMPSRRAPNCATAPRNANAVTAFIAPCDYERQTNGAAVSCALDKLAGARLSLWAFEPTIADGKRECAVVTGIMRAQARAR